jgi:hypothetical protein
MEKGTEDRDNNLLSGLILDVYNPPNVSITDVSGVYDGAINGIKVDRPFSSFQFVMESIR